VENLLKYSLLNLLEKVKFNSGGGVWSLVRIQSPRLMKRLGNLMIAEPFRSLAVDFIRGF
jgi:hypothetical protein